MDFSHSHSASDVDSKRLFIYKTYFNGETMTRQVIVAGDTLAPYGGEVLSESDADKIDGKSIARKSDLVRCAKHDTNPIEEGDDSFLIDGKAVALEGHRASCGCTLVSRRATLAIS